MLGLAGCSHAARFVVVATEPQLGEIGKSDIACEFCRVEVAVVVHDRLVGSYFVVETVRRFSGDTQELLDCLTSGRFVPRKPKNNTAIREVMETVHSVWKHHGIPFNMS